MGAQRVLLAAFSAWVCVAWVGVVGREEARAGASTDPQQGPRTHTHIVDAAGSLYTYASDTSVGRSDSAADMLMWNVSCAVDHYVPRVATCHPTKCARRLIDNLVSADEVAVLRGIVEKGMASAPADGGPTILDVNSGYMRDTEGLKRIYPGVKFTEEEYSTYAGVFDKIHAVITDTFGLGDLWFTAPTFITRLIGNPEWQPAGMHDEYWTKHVDKRNTEHYDYSGLLYLSTYGEDFQGGKFVFYDEGSNHTIEPRAGRFLTFSAGDENLHQVQRVESGTRLTMSMWFTCDSTREFTTFLDGKVHSTFKHAPAQSTGSSDEL